MSQTSCCVPGCTSTSEKGVSLHRFPNPDTDLERFRTWIIKIGGDIVGLDNHFIFKNRRVCTLHFHPMHIYTRKLSTQAIPQLNLPGVPVRRPPLAPIDLNIGRELVPLAHGNIAIAPEVVVGVPVPSTSQQNFIEHQDEPVYKQLFAPDCFEERLQSTGRKSITKQQKIKTACVTCKTMNKEERKLNIVVRKLKKKIMNAEKHNKEIKNKLLLTRKMINSQAYEISTKNLNSTAKLFFAMQIKQALKKSRGRRFTLDEKILALSLYKPSPKCYKILRQICVLPHRRTLDKLIHKVNLKCGINSILFDHLKKRVKKMPKSHKYCSVIFDEMAISAQLNYDKTEDEINGFCNDGYSINTQFCDHALVFMVRGVFKKYKQPVAFSFCSGATKSQNLVGQLESVIKKVQETGLIVVTTVSDQGANNIAAINSIMERTKQKYLRCNEEWRGGFYEIEDSKIFHIFDPPHLIKGIRNNLLTKNLIYNQEGHQKIAKWSHIEALLRRGPQYKGCKLGHKLTDQHVVPHRIPKMRVKMATQVFSHSVGTTLGYMAEIGKLPEECKDTADLMLIFDELFDSVNGSYSKSDEGKKIYRTAVTPKSPHHKLWKKYLPILKTMMFIDRNGKKNVVPSINSWVKTIETFQNITSQLEKEGITSLLLRNFNQDPLENFFGAIRAHGQNNVMPDSIHFINSFKILLINNMTSKNSVGANCENDDTEYLQSLKYLLTLPPRNENKNDPENIHSEHLNINLINTDQLIKSEEFDDKEKCAAAAYCCGWLLNISKKKFRKCTQCKNDLECSQEENFHRYISMKKYSASSWLHYPTRDFLDYFIQVENITCTILQIYPFQRNIATYIKLIVDVNINSSFLKCQDHREDMQKFLLNRSVTFFINNYVKEINNLLSGKISNWDKSDSLKNMAHNYYLKHKKK